MLEPKRHRLLLLALCYLLQTGVVLAQSRGDDDLAGCAACGGCSVFFIVIFVAVIAVNVGLLVWVARDAKSRGMDSAVIWMILVMLTGVVGLIIYLFSRPQGNMMRCVHCGNNRLQASAKCPHCGNT